MFSALDPIVDLAFFLNDIFTIKNPLHTFTFLMIITFSILFYEIALPCIPIAIIIIILSNSYYMRRFSVGKA
jgi:hypothetical protein